MHTTIVTEYLDDTASRFPDKVAFVDERRGITFKELREEALCVAMALTEQGLFKHPIVVFMEKSVECIAAFLGVAYSGNFYVPIDIEMPSSRIEKIMKTLQPKQIITDRQSKEKIGTWGKSIPVASYEEMLQKPCDTSLLSEVTKKVLDGDVLYVLFTSGSTGVPKGVVIPHRGVVAYTEWVTETFGVNENTVLGNQTPFYFSMSVLDIYQTLRNGCTTYIIPKQLFSFPIKLLEYIGEHKINMLYWVPSALCLVVNLKALGKRDISCVSKVLFAGEVMPTKQLNLWRKELPDTLFANLFGPTEITDICNYYVLERDLADTETVPIGGLCSHVGGIILKEGDVLVKEHEMGELCIYGSALAYGYFNNLEKTRATFVQNPLNSKYPETIYRTGDLVHYNERGELVYDGRKDFQIKHMGHRIELGEIETAVSSLEGIRQNCCLYNMEKGQIVLAYAGDLDGEEVVEQLKKLLPEYMLPNKKIKLDVLPLNANGKIDRVKLREML